MDTYIVLGLGIGLIGTIFSISLVIFWTRFY